MLKNKLMEVTLLKDKISFIEVILINQPGGKCLDTHISKKAFYNYQKNIKHLIKTKPKRTVSNVKLYNNYKEVNIGMKYYYYDMRLLRNAVFKVKKLNFLVKSNDDKILDPVLFPDFKKYHSNYIETSYKYKYMPDNRVINSIDIYFANIVEEDRTSYNIYLKFRVCDKNKSKILDNLLTIINKLNFVPSYRKQ